MKRDYNRIVIGASIRGCALGIREEDTLVIESSIHLGSDFVFCCSSGIKEIVQPQNVYAKKFYQKLLSCNALVEGKMQNAALMPIFTNWCIENKLNVLLAARVFNISEHSVQVITVEGVEKFSSKLPIIDARAKFVEYKYLTAYIYSEKSISDGNYGKFVINSTSTENRYELKLKLDKSCSWQDARAKFRELWDTRSEELKNAIVSWIGVKFLSDQYDNCIAALDAAFEEVL